MSIAFIDVAKFYDALPHQNAALNWLQSQVPAETLAQFAQMWRSAPQLKQFITLDDLLKITTNAPKSRLQAFVRPLNEGLEQFGVNNRLRICHFLAQILHESTEFLHQEETASGADYEGRVDLGNIKAGDGQRFKGRGLIQITGRYNYSQLSKELGIDYLANPVWLANLPDCVWSAFWFWNHWDLSALADRDNFDEITRRVNGGYNGYDQRLAYLQRAKEVLIASDAG